MSSMSDTRGADLRRGTARGAEVRSGDAIVMPHGYHGPSMARPGYDLYYLNVMAGPERARRFGGDPRHAWIRDSRQGQPVDPRLPVTAGGRNP